MEHDELVREVSAKLGDLRLGEAAVSSVRDTIRDALAVGEPVNIPGFGTFEPCEPGPRRSRHDVRFRAGASFRRAVNAPSTAHVPDSRVTFRRFDLPPGTSLSAVIGPDESRCGVYRLEFEGGHEYVGQARNVVSRFASHRRRWGDRIVAVSFAEADPRDLDDLERRTIQHCEGQGVPLYNSALVGMPMGESPLDVVVDRVEQEQWLSGEGAGGWLAPPQRLEEVAAREAASDRFRLLSGHPAYGLVRLVLAIYVAAFVAEPATTERRFWSLSAMPSTNRSRDHRRLCGLSVNNVEALVVLQEGERVVWFVNLSPGLIDASRWQPQPGRYRSVGLVDRVWFDDFGEFVDVLDDEGFIAAGRRFALGLMRKGHGMLARHHDDALADSVFLELAEIDAQV